MTAPEGELLDAVLAAHHASVFRGNVSTVCLRTAYAGSNDYSKALVAALSSIGGLHAPIAETKRLLEHPDCLALARAMLKVGQKVPGWGNSFVHGSPDFIWGRVDELLKGWQGLHGRLDSITCLLHESGKKVWPNPSAYTAATAIALEMPTAVSPWLFVSGRLDGWSRLLLEAPC